MAISNYTELKSAVASWLNRGDLTSVIPDLIALAEARISIDVKDIPPFFKTTTITLVNGTASYSVSDLISPVRAIRSDGEKLGLITPELAAGETTTGTPEWFASDGASITFKPIPNASGTVTLTYKGRITSLSDSAATNSVLTRFPALYLYAALQEAAPFLSDDARITIWNAKYQEALNMAKSGNYSGNVTLRMDELVTPSSDIINGL